MINNLSDLISAFKAWWHAPITFERKEKVMTPEEFKKLPPSVMDLISNAPLKRYRDQYYDELRARRKAGEKLSSEEAYRLRMHDDISNLNYGLDHPDEFLKF